MTAISGTVRQVMGLAFLPLDRVLPTIGEITNAQRDDETVHFLEYFMGQWIVRIRPEMWNVRGRVHRTNNDLESWHNRINQDLDGQRTSSSSNP